MSYNGWTNRATWALALHLGNNEGDYTYWNEQTAEACTDADDKDEAVENIATQLENWLDELYEMIESAATTGGEQVSQEAWSLMSDVGLDTSDVDFREIATNWVDESWDENHEDEDEDKDEEL